MKNIYFFDYPIGRIGIASDDESICGIFLQGDKVPQDISEEKKTKVISEADKQLKEYFSGKRKEFNLPLKMNGTEFQKSVWNALLTIPYGETRSYKDIAIQVGNEKASRAIGMANNRNPIAIVVPCHRVIGHNGTLVGYGGGLNMKRELLDLEKAKYVND